MPTSRIESPICSPPSANPTSDAEAWLADRRQRWIMGTPEQAIERVRAFEASGTQRLMLQDFVPRDLDHIRLIGRLFR